MKKGVVMKRCICGAMKQSHGESGNAALHSSLSAPSAPNEKFIMWYM